MAKKQWQLVLTSFAAGDTAQEAAENYLELLQKTGMSVVLMVVPQTAQSILKDGFSTRSDVTWTEVTIYPKEG